MLNYIRTNIQNANFMSLMAYYKRTFEKGFQTLYNKHSTYEIMYVVSGKCTVFFLDEQNSDKKEKIIINKNEFVFIDCDLPHKLIVDEECRIYNVEFKPVYKENSPVDVLSILKNNDQLKVFLEEKFGFFICHDSERILDVIKIIHTIETEKSKVQSVLEAATMELQSQMAILDLFINVLKCTISDKRRLSYGAYYSNRAIEYILSNYADGTISVNQIASLLKVNKTYLQKLFKANTGKTITEYIIDTRIRDAQNLLKVGNMPVVDIAFEVGFNSRQNFYLSFKKKLGISPNEYRNLIINEQIEVFDDNRINFNKTLDD